MTKPQYAAVLANWAQRHGFTVEEAAEVVRLARKCGTLNTHAVNGDFHPRMPITKLPKGGDKSDNAREWEKDLDRWSGKLLELVSAKGFTVRYNGIYPSLQRNGAAPGDTVIIPLDK